MIQVFIITMGNPFEISQLGMDLPIIGLCVFVGYIFEDKKGNIWTSSQTANGWALSRYDEKSLSNERPTVTEIKSEDEVTRRMIFGISEARDGSIWFGALNGVRRYDGNTITDFKVKEVQK